VTQRDKLLVTLAAVVGVLAAGWFLVVAPKRQDARRLDEQIATARTQLAGTAGRAAQYRAARDDLRKHPEAFRRAGRALPNRASMPELLRTLTATTQGTGVTLGDLTTGGAAGGAGATTSTPGIGSVGLQLSFTGNFLSLQRYLGRLERFVNVSRDDVDAKGRLLALNSVQLTPGEDSKLSAKVSATVYVLQPGGLAATAPATTAPGTAPAPVPASAPSSASARSPPAPVPGSALSSASGRPPLAAPPDVARSSDPGRERSASMKGQ